jgi:hypothetical protein
MDKLLIIMYRLHIYNIFNLLPSFLKGRGQREEEGKGLKLRKDF